jgi:hypothetical protein
LILRNFGKRDGKRKNTALCRIYQTLFGRKQIGYTGPILSRTVGKTGVRQIDSGPNDKVIAAGRSWSLVGPLSMNMNA